MVQVKHGISRPLIKTFAPANFLKKDLQRRGENRRHQERSDEQEDDLFHFLTLNTPQRGGINANGPENRKRRLLPWLVWQIVEETRPQPIEIA